MRNVQELDGKQDSYAKSYPHKTEKERGESLLVMKEIYGRLARRVKNSYHYVIRFGEIFGVYFFVFDITSLFRLQEAQADVP